MVLQNYVVLQAGKSTRLHFVRADRVVKTITDPLTRQPKEVTSLVLQVDEMDGERVAAMLSVLAEGLAVQLEAFIRAGSLTDYDFVITPSGEGFLRTYSVTPIRRR